MHYTLSPIYSPKNRGPESQPGKSRRKLLQVFTQGWKGREDEKARKNKWATKQLQSTEGYPDCQPSYRPAQCGRTRRSLWEEQLCKHLLNFPDGFQSHLGRLPGGVVKTMNPGALLPGLDPGSTAYWVGTLEKAPEPSLPQLPIQPISPSIDLPSHSSHGAAGKMQ